MPTTDAKFAKKIETMEKKSISVIYDRRKTVAKTGTGTVDICVYLGNRTRKYISIKNCSPYEWEVYAKSPELQLQKKIYSAIVESMLKCGEELTVENFNKHLGITPENTSSAIIERRKRMSSPNGFINFIKEEMEKETLAPGTLGRRDVVLKALERYGKLNRFADVTDKGVKGFDDFLRAEDKTRTDQCLNNYHKVVKKYSRLAFQMDYIAKNPYDSPLCKFKRGKSNERHPLSEEELKVVISLKNLQAPEENARDLFIFASYTGLSYGDTQAFDFKTMTEKIGDTYYIDGERIKNGHSYFTPILPPAMAILKKHNYKLPKISNQKLDFYLHNVERLAKLNKPMTSHVARHTFATIVLNYDIPIEDLARMLGHHNIRTTQIYAKISKKNVSRHTSTLSEKISASGMMSEIKKHRGRPRKETRTVTVPSVPDVEPIEQVDQPVPDVKPAKKAKHKNKASAKPAQIEAQSSYTIGWDCSFTYC